MRYLIEALKEVADSDTELPVHVSSDFLSRNLEGYALALLEDGASVDDFLNFRWKRNIDSQEPLPVLECAEAYAREKNLCYKDAHILALAAFFHPDNHAIKGERGQPLAVGEVRRFWKIHPEFKTEDVAAHHYFQAVGFNGLSGLAYLAYLRARSCPEMSRVVG